jgi:hypothetical protein
MLKRHLVVLVAFLLGACGSSTVAAPSPQPTAACAVTGIFDPRATLVAPAKGATAVAPTIGTISFVVGNPALQNGTVTLTGQGAAGAPPTYLTAGAITTANGVSTAAIPPLAPMTTYTVIVKATLPAPPDTNCAGNVTGNLGTFTTASS